MADENNPKGNKSQFKSTLIKYCILFGVFIIVGAVMQHYVVEHFIGQNLQKTLDTCYSDKNILNYENIACIKDKTDCTGSLTECSTKLEKLNSDYSADLDKLIACKKDCNTQ